MDKNMISVIMPAYNTEKYIGKSIESVLAQDYDNFELIIIDDGSKDNTKNIIRQYAKKDNRIKLIIQENQGVSAARNTGIDIAQGDYIAFLDSDDLWDRDNLSTMLAEALHSKSSFVCAKMDIINADGMKEDGNTSARDGSLLDFVTKNNEIRIFWGSGSVLIKRDVLGGGGRDRCAL